VVVRGVTGTKSRRRDASRSRGRESRSRLSAPDRLTSALVGNEAAVDHVGELPLERPHRFLLALALGELAAEEDLAGRGVNRQPVAGRQGVFESSRRDPRDARLRACVPPPHNHEGVSSHRIRWPLPYCTRASAAELPCWAGTTTPCLDTARSPTRGVSGSCTPLPRDCSLRVSAACEVQLLEGVIDQQLSGTSASSGRTVRIVPADPAPRPTSSGSGWRPRSRDGSPRPLP
jgi:hypothetical protein